MTQTVSIPVRGKTPLQHASNKHARSFQKVSIPVRGKTPLQRITIIVGRMRPSCFNPRERQNPVATANKPYFAPIFAFPACFWLSLHVFAFTSSPHTSIFAEIRRKWAFFRREPLPCAAIAWGSRNAFGGEISPCSASVPCPSPSCGPYLHKRQTLPAASVCAAPTPPTRSRCTRTRP